MNIKNTINKYVNKYVNEENKTVLIGLLTILILLWIILYFIPEVFISLFGTFLGNIILIVITLLVSMNNYVYGFVLGVTFIIFYRFYTLSRNPHPPPINTKESFQNIQNNNNLSEDSIKKFLNIQTTINKQTNFDIEKLKQQVTQREMNYFLKNGMWPWSREVIALYHDALSKNVFIRNHSSESIKYARTIYNQNAILEVLSLQTKEGTFLVNGVSIHKNKNPLEDLPNGFGSFGYKSGLITPMNDVIKCNIDPYGNNSKLEKIHYTGKGGIFGEQDSVVTPVNYTKLETEIPGFEFIDGPCNPCKVFDQPSDYSCRFKLSVKDKEKGISPIWKYLMNI
jgi:hypothetical protein